jgi:hypothetical protein
MKLFLGFFFLLASFGGLAQNKPFEGSVHYRVSYEPERGGVNLVVLFGKKGVIVQTMDTLNNLQQEILVNLDSGYSYVLETKAQTYHKRKLSVKSSVIPVKPGKRTIAGYATTGVDVTRPGHPIDNLNFVKLSRRAVAFVADELWYPVPEKFLENYEFMFLHEGRIILGAEVELGMDPVGDEEGFSMVFTINATQVVPGKVSEARFSIPEGFQEEKQYEYLMQDSLLAAPDTSGMAYPDKDTLENNVPVSTSQKATPGKTKADGMTKVKKTIAPGVEVTLEEVVVVEEVTPPPPPRPEQKPARKIPKLKNK